SADLMDSKKYTFDVALTATKLQVRDAIEEIFDVKVKSVNIMNVRGKEKRVGRYTGKTARRRKAIVALTEDSN
ncbi:50S ribosomal protein L23, partial [Streptococcus thermophilus]|nr:50S ribosomal protein L23 [Streptococcus thermophilus]